ncbi:HNH endonuclease signature motif containing protein [Rhodanobacter soli]|uniref:HNH endonuclease n=1 Tax=Rhodanobacter soli TaxID=590609 RepID=UPI0031DF100B
MNTFQTLSIRTIRDMAAELQLDAYAIVSSGNGTEYKNFLNRTVFTVYHDRLDSANFGFVEVALGSENIANELGVSESWTQQWVKSIQTRHAKAARKPIPNWERVALKSPTEVKSFCDEFRHLYKEHPAEAVGIPSTPAQKAASPPIDERIIREISARRGQPAFRDALIAAYGVCAISGCEDIQALEAAHIRPHSEGSDYRTNNGILLRADIHTLFDLRLVSIEPQSGIVVVAAGLGATYQKYSGNPTRLPLSPADHPDPSALKEHYRAWIDA